MPGQLNRLIDDLVHPLFKKGQSFALIASLLNPLVEQNLSGTTRNP